MLSIYKDIPQKNKIMLFIFSLLSSLFFQILIFDTDFDMLTSFNRPRKAVITETNQYEIDGNSYTATSQQAQIFLDSDTLPISWLHISFEKPLNYHLFFQIYYITEGQVASVLESVEGTCFATESDIFVSLPLGTYETIRIDFNNNKNSNFLLKDIVFLAESPTVLETIFSKLSLVPTVFFSVLFFFIFCFMKTEVGKNFFPFFFVGLLTTYFFSLQELSIDDTHSFILKKDLYSSLLSYTIDRYKTWTSRQLIESILFYIVHYKILWTLISGCLSALLCWSISKLLNTTSLQINWFIVGMFLLYPLQHMSTAGWVATTTNYLWPLTFAILSLQTIKKSVYDEKITKKSLIFQCIFTLYASNMEQLAALLCGFFTVFVLYFKYIKKPVKILYPQLIISFLSIIYHVTCPGSYARRLYDIERYNPEFYYIPTLEKIEMTYSYTLSSFFINDNTILLMFSLVLLLFSFYHKKILSTCFIILTLAITSIFHYSGLSLPFISKIKNAFTETGTGLLLSSPSTWIPDLLVTFTFTSILLSLYFLFEDKKKSLLLMVILLAGFASRLILFSTVTVNLFLSIRTYMFMYFAFIVVSVFIYQELTKISNKKYIMAVNLLLATFATAEVFLLFTRVSAFT